MTMAANCTPKQSKKSWKIGAIGKDVRDVTSETSMFGKEAKENGTVCVVGPDAYKARDWYAEVITKDWMIIKIK